MVNNLPPAPTPTQNLTIFYKVQTFKKHYTDVVDYIILDISHYCQIAALLLRHLNGLFPQFCKQMKILSILLHVLPLEV